MLSILIPTYNFNITPLVMELHKQCKACNIEFEILAYDDGSNSKLNEVNSKLNELELCTFKSLSQNIGRSAIRNLLGQEAQYKVLLFVDAGTKPKHSSFIKTYLNLEGYNIASGGMTHLENKPEKPFKLRWVFTKKREFKSLCSSNFIIKKNILNSHPFDDNLTQYGFEDVLFFEKLEENNFKIHFFNNPVVHLSDDSANVFIMKTEKALKNLSYLIDTGKLNPENQRMYKLYKNLNRFNLDSLTYIIFKLLKPMLLKNFNSSFPSILLFDFYRIGYFCYLKNN